MSTSFVIMAAGLGSRYGGIKQMEGVGPNNEILLEYAIYDALEAGFDKVVVILRPDIVEDFRERVGSRLEKHVQLAYAVQDFNSIPSFYAIPPERSKPFGTIHAVLTARQCIDGPFAVLNADDYYGRTAFGDLYRALPTLRGAGDGCMVAYQLQNTVSPNGSVTRGVCAVEDGRLTRIDETSGIELLPDGSIAANGRTLPGNTPVSMNLWGFTREALDDMDAYFHDFLRALPEGECKAECLLPVYVGDRIREGKMNIRVLTTGEGWFGMTYKEDWPTTRSSLQAFHDQGVYPPVLFR